MQGQSGDFVHFKEYPKVQNPGQSEAELDLGLAQDLSGLVRFPQPNDGLLLLTIVHSVNIY